MLIRLQLLMLCLVFAGCTSTPPDARDFVQGKIHIAPPVTRLLGSPAISDGGTLQVPIRDRNGREFVLFIDHRIESPTPGAIYLNAYPTDRNSIRVRDISDFKSKVGDFDDH